MADNDFTDKSSRRLIDGWQSVDLAFIDLAKSNPPELVKSVILDLSIAREFKINSEYNLPFAFRTIYMSKATDPNAEIRVVPYGGDIQGTTGSHPLGFKDVLSFDKAIKGVALAWDAQPNVVVELSFILFGSFQAGTTNVQVIASTTNNSIVIPASPLTIDVVPIKIADSNILRRRINWSCSAISSFFLGNNVAGPFFPVAAIDRLDNTSELWAQSPLGAYTLYVMEEF